MLNLSACYISTKMNTEMDLVQALLVSITICDLVQSVLGFLPECIIASFKPEIINKDNITCVASGSIIHSHVQLLSSFILLA